jgi:hypothetical protein
MAFLPDNYSLPTNSAYMKFEAGDNKFRILDSPILGNEYWNHANKPIRKRLGEEIDIADIRVEEGRSAEVKHFWALPVWSYKESKVMVLEITQKGVLTQIRDYVADEDWSNPREYDFLVTKTGSGLETKYAVKTKKPTPIEETVAKAWYEVQSKGFDLNELFHSGDPFNPIQRASTQLQAVAEIMDAPTPPLSATSPHKATKMVVGQMAKGTYTAMITSTTELKAEDESTYLEVVTSKGKAVVWDVALIAELSGKEDQVVTCTVDHDEDGFAVIGAVTN